MMSFFLTPYIFLWSILNGLLAIGLLQLLNGAKRAGIKSDSRKSRDDRPHCVSQKIGRSAPYSLRYFLEWNNVSQSWQIAKICN